MTMTVKGRYEDGVLRLDEALPLDEGTEVEVAVTVTSGGVIPCHASPEEVYRNILEIAALYEPHEGDEPFSGEDHDQVLYGETGAA